MFSTDKPLKDPLFHYYAPLSEDFCGLLSIPHSGESVPKAFHPYLLDNPQAWQEDVDFKVHELVDIRALQEAGVAVMVSDIHRICVDLNRSPETAVLYWQNNTQGVPLVSSMPSPDEVNSFINQYHAPYFEMLKANLQELEKRKKGAITVIDLHSMPSSPTDYHKNKNPHQKSYREDFCLSDRRGITCDPQFIEFFRKLFEGESFSCGINDPYIGGYITEYVDRFRSNNIQIEINRRLYMDERTKKIYPDKVKTLESVLTHILLTGFKKFNS